MTIIRFSKHRFIELYNIRSYHMKTNNKALSTGKKDDTKMILITGIIILLLQLTFHITVDAKSSAHFQLSTEDSIKFELNRQLNSPAVLKQLNFPNTVKRFYVLNSFETNWLRPEQNIGPTASAMLLLDCVRQYGLQRETYHPQILNYIHMHDILGTEKYCSIEQRVGFELMLTDAMISMINHLHFGAYNPYLNNLAIDKGIPDQLKAEDFLQKASNSLRLMDTILTVQPKFEQYQQLQSYMRLIAGQYICDSYEIPEGEIRTIALNMERLRWVNWPIGSLVHINIPSFILSYKQADTTYEFKVVVGKEKTPSPILQSHISYLETAPDWKVPQSIFIKELLPKALKDSTYFDQNHMAVYDEQENLVSIDKNTLTKIKLHPKNYHVKQTAGCDNALGKVVFRFPNAFDIYLHDSPEKQLFKNANRANSHGCIRVERADFLAELLLKADQQSLKTASLQTAMKAYIKKNFLFKKPIPIIITYLTCTVRDGLLQFHDDLYQLDSSLMIKMYDKTEQFTKN